MSENMKYEYDVIVEDITDNLYLIPAELLNMSVEQQFLHENVVHMVEKVCFEAIKRAEEHDASTPSGRKALISLARAVGRHKTHVDGKGKQLVADWKAKAKIIDQERKYVRDEWDTLRDHIRQPVTDWENAEKLRTDLIESKLDHLKNIANETRDTSADYEVLIRELEAREIVETDFQERFVEACELVDEVLLNLRIKQRNLAEQEARDAELAKLKAEMEARRKQDEEERLRKEGEERAQREAEEKERKLKEESERVLRKAQEDKARSEQEKEEAIQKARDAELLAQAKIREAEEESIRKIEEAKRWAEAKARQSQAQARAKQEESVKREADEQIRFQTTKEIAADICAHAHLYPQYATAVANAIADGKIRHITVEW